ILLYAFAQRLGKDAPQRRDRWSSGEDPALLEQIPNAALLFRRGDVVRARETVVLSPSEADVYERKTSPLSSRALRTVVERNRVVVRLPHRSAQKKSQQNERIVTDMNTDFSGGHHGYVTSDTGELRRDFRRGIFFIETEKTRGASGRLGGAVHALGSV